MQQRCFCTAKTRRQQMYLGGTFADEVYAPYICKRQYPCYTIAMNISRKVPIGIQSFEKLRRDRYLYVDKTAFVWNLIQ